MDSDRNLLFGVLALQLELIDAKQFGDACAGWAARKDQSLSDVLVERGWITANDRQEVERVLERKLVKHGGDIRQTLGAVADGNVREALSKITPEPSPQSTDDRATPPDQVLTSTLAIPPEKRSRYSLIRLHAEGGLGRVFIALDNDLNREVALKEIKARQLEQPEARRRFVREAQVTGQLEHPSIVPIYELVCRPEDVPPYYTMQLIRGQTLREAIADYHARRKRKETGKRELNRLLGAFGNVCQAIAYAHSRGVIHRDLKPENVILGAFGEVVVLDWGLAKTVGKSEDSDEAQVTVSADAGAQATAAGRILGTPAYLSPEQAEGRLDLIDFRTDVYGLGAVLFEILTGHAPHEGSNSAEVIRQTVTGPTPRARFVERTVPLALDAVCAKAMDRDRGKRYARATDLAQDVQCYLADEPVSAYRESWPRRVGRWVRHHRAWTTTAATTAAAVLLTTGVAAVRLGQMASEERDLREAVEVAREQGMRVAARFAANSIAGEIDLRWRILEAEANDADLHRLVLEDDPNWEDLQKWLKARYDKHYATTKATSWFLTDAKGTQLARHPPAETTGRNFAFRDYFNGLRRDLSPEDAIDVAPIHDVHRSIVFLSQATSHRMVAFSVPIWSGAIDMKGRKVLGVLAMTVELGRFNALRLDLGKDKVAVLADTREDWVEGEPKRGLLLHHPLLAEERAQQKPGSKQPLPILRLDPGTVEILEKLRVEKLQRDEDYEKESGQSFVILQPLPGSLDRDYHDPAGGEYAGVWIAAFEPVFVRGRAEAIKDTGWVVIIQERRYPKSGAK